MPVDWDALVLAPCQVAFGDIATITNQMGLVVTLADAVLDRSFVSIPGEDGGAPVTQWQTLLGVRLASGPPGWAPSQGDVVTVGGKSWFIADIQPDGKGHAIFVLSVMP